MRLAWANVSTYNDADVAVFGVPDEKGTASLRTGSSKAPNQIRKVSNERNIIKRDGKRSVFLPQICPLNKNIYDNGNITKKAASKFAEKTVRDGKLPVAIGGDHSITTAILNGIDRVGEKISVVYLDSHPDFICSSRDYYGSVVCDISDYRNIDFFSSIELGIREPEAEELINLRKKHLRTVSAYEIKELGINKTVEEVRKKVKHPIYLSIDMDIVDPAYAPGVSTPSPGGISSNDLIRLVTGIAKLGLVGLDVVEVTPKHDIQDMTSHLASKAIIEAISCAEMRK